MEVRENDGHRCPYVHFVFSSREGALLGGSFLDSGHREFQEDSAIIRNVRNPRVPCADLDRDVFEHGPLRPRHVPRVHDAGDLA